jgi:hypothetical protein
MIEVVAQRIQDLGHTKERITRRQLVERLTEPPVLSENMELKAGRPDQRPTVLIPRHVRMLGSKRNRHGLMIPEATAVGQSPLCKGCLRKGRVVRECCPAYTSAPGCCRCPPRRGCRRRLPQFHEDY